MKPKELDHDADLYKVYRRAAEEIREKGAKPTRVRLDFELKESINRAKEAAARLTEDERRRLLATVAEEQGLTLYDGSIHLPDIQVEYETRDGELERQYCSPGTTEKRAFGARLRQVSGSMREAETATAFVALCTTRAWFERFCQYDHDRIPVRRASPSRLHEARE